jgi:hypothetical protein
VPSAAKRAQVLKQEHCMVTMLAEQQQQQQQQQQ